MALPSVRAILTSDAPPPNPQDLSAYAMVVGPCSAGPLNTPTEINNPSDLTQFGYGPGIEQAAEILSVAGSPVYFTRSTTTTPGAVLGDLTKAGGEGADTELFGSIIAPGAILIPGDMGDVNGGVFIQAKTPGVTITVATGMALAITNVGKDITLTVAAMTTAAQVEALALPAGVDLLINQPVGQGTKAGIVKQGQAKTQFGDVRFQSKVPGVTLTIASGMMAGYAVTGGTNVTLTVTSTTTATAVAALALGGAAALLETPVVVGMGASLSGQTFAQTPFDRGAVVYKAAGPEARLIPGADANGGVIYLGKRKGLSVQQINPGANSTLRVVPVGSRLDVYLATDGAGVITSTALAVAAAVNANATAAAMLSAKATGTGLGLTLAAATTALSTLQIAHTIAGNNTALSVSLSGSTVTVNVATDANGQNTSLANDILAAIAASGNADFVLDTPTTPSSGLGLVGAKAATDLLWGDTGAASLSGTPNDLYHLQIRITRTGTVGGDPAPTMQWAVDTLAGTSTDPNWSAVTLIPGTGIVPLRNGAIDTGLTVTFTGNLTEGDLWIADTSAPTSGSTDVLAAMDAAIAETRFQWGYLTGPDSTSRSEATLYDGRLQTVFQQGARDIQGMFTARDQGEGVPGETEQQWIAALENDFLGYQSPRGFLSMTAGSILHISPYTQRQYKRPLVFVAASRKSAIPIHEDLGKVGTGPLRDTLYIYHDEFKVPGLFDARFISSITYPQRPGFFYVAGAPTMADPFAPADAGYTLYERVSIALAIARISQEVALNYLNDSIAGTALPDKAAGSVAGAIDLIAAKQIETRVNYAVETFVFKAKSDGKASATPLPPGEKMVKVRRDNNFLNDRTIFMDCKYIPLGLAQFIVITVSVTIPS